MLLQVLAAPWTAPSGVTSVEVLVVAGGGGAGGLGGGGGAGGVVHHTSKSVSPGTSYTVTVGTGGAGGTYTNTAAGPGTNSVFDDITALGGGCSRSATGQGTLDGGSGGGGSTDARTGGSATQGDSGGGTGYGNDGGEGFASGNYAGGGGGGANAAGSDATITVGGDGGAGKLFSTFVAYGTDSSNVASTGSNGGYFGGGAGGSNQTGTGAASTGGVGGGGNGIKGNVSGNAGMANTGGGGSGSGESGTGGAGGSGVVLIKYTGHTITANGDVANTRGSNLGATYTQVDAITAAGAGTWTCPTGVTSVEILTVAGGGGAGDPGVSTGGGGGAGGVVHNSSYTVVPGVVYDVTVGAGGAKGTGGSPTGSDGSDSVFNVNAEGSGATVTALGGGGGGQYSTDGNPGGSGGGQGSYENSANTGTGDQGDSGGGTGYGNDGGTGLYTGGGDKSGGGGGAGGAGGNATTSEVGDGGVGKLFSTFVAYGTDSSNVASTGANGGYFGGGGGGASNNTGGAGGPGIGGVGGGATSTYNGSASNGQANTGGGGGASGASGTPSDGGSGVVLIAYSQDKPGTSSIVFDGSSDELSVADSSDWDLSNQPFTWELWVNPTDTGASTWPTIVEQYQSSTERTYLRIERQSGEDRYEFEIDSSGTNFEVVSDGAPNYGSWEHIAVCRVGDVFTMYVDGVAQSSPITNSLTVNARSAPLAMGKWGGGNTDGDYQGYMDEIRVSDVARYTTGFTPQTTQFTSDANTMLLIHSDFDGGLGADSSGNKNDFTPTNLVASDKMVDSPTNNFCTFNSAIKHDSPAVTISEGNLRLYEATGSTWAGGVGTIGLSSGKWYWESLIIDTGAYLQQGICSNISVAALGGGSSPQESSGTVLYYSATGNKILSGTDLGTYGATYGDGDIIGTALNLDDSEITFYKK